MFGTGCKNSLGSTNGAGRGSSPLLDSFTAVQLARASLPCGGAGGAITMPRNTAHERLGSTAPKAKYYSVGLLLSGWVRNIFAFEDARN